MMEAFANVRRAQNKLAAFLMICSFHGTTGRYTWAAKVHSKVHKKLGAAAFPKNPRQNLTWGDLKLNPAKTMKTLQYDISEDEHEYRNMCVAGSVTTGC